MIRLLLEAYYEPQFSDRSHGFRPRRGCHTALTEVADKWTGTTWFIEGDISDCFGSLDHEIMLATLAEKIHDNRFLRLVRNMLQAGYLEDWEWNATLSGAPQGGVVIPNPVQHLPGPAGQISSKAVLIPEYTRGGTKGRQPCDQRKMQYAITRARDRPTATRRGSCANAASAAQQGSSRSGYRRLRYVRYADDTLLGFTGPKAEAEQIKTRLAEFLHDDLKLELSQHKTLITHARTGAARFLGYEITVQHSDHQITDGQRRVNGTIGLRVPGR